MSATYFLHPTVSLTSDGDEALLHINDWMSNSPTSTPLDAKAMRQLAAALHKCADALDPRPQPDMCRHGVLKVLHCYECNRND